MKVLACADFAYSLPDGVLASRRDACAKNGFGVVEGSSNGWPLELL
jgi:hypothetical protein